MKPVGVGVSSYIFATATTTTTTRNRTSRFRLFRWFPFFLVTCTTTTTPLSLGILKSSANNNNNNNNAAPLDNTLDYSNHKPKISSNNNNNNDNNMISEDDQKFLERVRSSLKTVQQWDADPELLQECRNQIPWEELRGNDGDENDGNNFSSEDRLLDSSNALFLQRLCRWFPKQVMTWVNTPPCKDCGAKDCEMKTVRGAETEEEKDGEAKRVEGA
jgi:hypothetical protein